MRETSEILKAWNSLEPGEVAILATVVSVEGSSYRKPGARLLLTENGWKAGSISGGCLEAELVKTAFERTEVGSVLARFDSTSDDDIFFGYGLGCRGVVDVLIERLPVDGGVLNCFTKVIKDRKTGHLALFYDSETRVSSYDFSFEPDWSSFCRGAIFEQIVSPPQALVIFGAGHDAIPLVQMAKLIGWHVTVVDGRAEYLKQAGISIADQLIQFSSSNPFEIEDGDAAVIMTHSYMSDSLHLQSLSNSNPSYIGILGPSRRTEQLFQDISGLQLAKIHAPIGLDLGASEPDEIALAIVAEILAATKNRSAGFLSCGSSLGSVQK